MALRRSIPEDFVFGVLTLALLIPLWTVRYPPFQDFPQYVALARTLADYNSTALGFKHVFALNLETYTLFPPFLAAALSYVFDPLVATKLVVSLVIVATPWALRILLRALDRPTQYAGFVLPLAYNAHVVMGFVGYVVGVMLMLWGFVFGVLAIESERRVWRIALALVTLACLYSHVVPFVFLIGGLGLATLVSGSYRTWWRMLLPVLPALVLFAHGLTQGSTGWSMLPVGMVKTIPNCPVYDETRITFSALPDWVSDVFAAQWDERVLLGLFIAGILVVLVGANSSLPAPAADHGASSTPDAISGIANGRRRSRVRVCLALLAPLGIALYFIMPRTCDWIWPIHARFLFVGVMLAVLVLPTLPRMALLGLGLALAITTVAVVGRTRDEFRTHAHEIGDLEPALAAIPRGKLVAALTVDKVSSPMRLAGFHHFGAYCQAFNGGLTMFSFATMPHWPIRIRPELGIPEVSWNFQFAPSAIVPAELAWAEYVLVRGPAPYAVALQFTQVYLGERWQVFRRRK